MAFVHMGTCEDGESMLARHGFADAHHFSDPKGRLYRAFGIGQAAPWFLLDPRLWARGLAALVSGHGLGVPRGDVHRLAGVFLLHKGRVVRGHPLATVYERPDYLALAEKPSESDASAGPR